MQDFKYTPEFVREFLNLWPQWEAAREKGTLMMRPLVACNYNEQENKLWETVSEQAWYTPSRKQNRVYSLDSIGPIVCDMEMAIERALSPKSRVRLKFHYLHGYKYSELAAIEGVSESAVKVNCKRSIEQIAEWLEAPKEPWPFEKVKEDSTSTHRRTYATFPR